MNISKELKSGLITDVVNMIGFQLSDVATVGLERYFEITIGTHLPKLNQADIDSSKNVTIKHLKEIAKLHKKPISELRKLNPHGAYDGKELTKHQLIYQIVFYMDAPDE